MRNIKLYTRWNTPLHQKDDFNDVQVINSFVSKKELNQRCYDYHYFDFELRRLKMLLICFYFFTNFSLVVLIKFVLIKKFNHLVKQKSFRGFSYLHVYIFNRGAFRSMPNIYGEALYENKWWIVILFKLFTGFTNSFTVDAWKGPKSTFKGSSKFPETKL